RRGGRHRRGCLEAHVHPSEEDRRRPRAAVLGGTPRRVGPLRQGAAAMDLSLTEDQELIASTAREVLASRVSTAGARALEGDPSGYSAALWKEMVELGWTGLAFPEEHGGVGGDFLDACLLFEQLGYARVPSPLPASVACCGM